MYVFPHPSLHLSTLRYRNGQFGFVIGSCGDILDLSHYQQTIQDSSENHVFVVQEVTFRAGDKELTSIRIPSRVGHR